MTTVVQMNADGSMTSSHSVTSKGFTSSEDYQQEGIVARSGMGSRTVADHTRLQDHEIIQIDGMELKVSQARDLGLIGGHTPDEGLNAGSSAQHTPEETPSETTGHAGYDQTLAELNSQVEAGNMTDTEATAYSTALGQIALAGMTVTEASDTIDGITDGSINPDLLPADQRQVVENLQSKVTDAATNSAMNEIGKQGFDRLAEIAKGDAEFDCILRHYASMRALGKASHTWSEFLTEAEAWSRGER